MLFTAAIAISFLLQVKFRFTKRRMRFAEYFFFGICTAFPLITIIPILINHEINPGLLGYCSFGTAVLYSGVMTPGERERTRVHLILFRHAPSLLALVIIVVCMAMLFWSVRNKEQRTRRYSVN